MTQHAIHTWSRTLAAHCGADHEKASVAAAQARSLNQVSTRRAHASVDGCRRRDEGVGGRDMWSTLSAEEIRLISW